MRLLLAFFAPCLLFLIKGRPVTGVICLVLQSTLIGWLPAALWAVYSLGQRRVHRCLPSELSTVLRTSRDA